MASAISRFLHRGVRMRAIAGVRVGAHAGVRAEFRVQLLHCGSHKEPIGFNRFSLSSFIVEFTRNHAGPAVSDLIPSSAISHRTKHLYSFLPSFLHRSFHKE